MLGTATPSDSQAGVAGRGSSSSTKSALWGNLICVPCEVIVITHRKLGVGSYRCHQNQACLTTSTKDSPTACAVTQFRAPILRLHLICVLNHIIVYHMRHTRLATNLLRPRTRRDRRTFLILLLIYVLSVRILFICVHGSIGCP